ncbi:MAG: M24 family metallopeptidase [Nitrososphaerales archaeon]
MTEPVYPTFTEKESERREKLVKKMMKDKGIDVLLLYNAGQSGAVSYLSNYQRALPTFLIYPLESEPALFLHFHNHIPCTKERSIIKDVRWNFNRPVQCVVECLTEKRLQKSKVGVVSLGSIPYDQLLQIKERFPEASFIDVSNDYNWIRWIRSEEEIEWFKKSAYLTDLTMEALEKRIEPGLSIHDLNAIVHDAFLKEGGELGIAYFGVTNMSDPDIFVPWQFPSAKKISRGDAVITEITVNNYGYNAQIHRPFAVGTEPTPLYQKLYDVAFECFENVSKALKPGATTEDVIAASSVIEDNGFTVYDSLVHGEAGKSPELGSNSSPHPKEPFRFKENMVIVIQPQPITRDYKAGLQLGAATVIRANGAANLHSYPFKFVVCK